MNTRFRPVIRVFVSSSFRDLKEERNALQREVFPRLEHYCLVRGFQFQAIDLRWGVPGEAKRDHRAMEICFEELRRAQDVSPRPNFLVLLGDRYGWQSLAETITEKEFGELERAADEVDRDAARKAPALGSATEALRTWYRRDENAVPVEYQLRSRNDWLGLPEWTEEDEEQAWKKVEEALWAAINHAYPTEGLAGRFGQQIPGPDEPLPSIVKFKASATEQETWRGALAVPDAPEHVIAWYRTIRNRDKYQHDQRADDFFDPDKALHVAASELKDELERRLHRDGKEDIQPVEVDLQLSADGEKFEVTCDHLQPLCDEIEARLREIVDEEIRAYWGPPGDPNAAVPTDQSGPSEARKVELEAQAHRLWGESRAPRDGFVGRDLELQAIDDYLRDEDDCNPLVIHGPSGTGKTALLARAAQVAEEHHKDRVFLRFLGTTAQSSNLNALLRSLCRELRPAEEREKDLPVELRLLQDEFDRLLSTATADQPILLFLDALDQLDEADGARQTYWLRTPLLPHVKVVVSCIRDEEGHAELNEPYRIFDRRKLLDRAIAVESLTAPDAMKAIDLWLQKDPRRPRHSRQLTTQQREAIAARITPDLATACRRPLYLRILFEECRLWPSWKKVEAAELGEDTAALLKSLFERLAQPAVHGPLLVKSALGYIATARRGLSETEILEVLWADPDYRQHLDDASGKTNHELPPGAMRIPIAIWSRLRHDLDPYLAERAVPGGTTIKFYHRQLAERAAEGNSYHAGLARYFERRADPGMDRTWQGESTRGFMELSFHLSQSDLEKLKQLLFDFTWLRAKTERRLVYELVADYDEATRTLKEEDPSRAALILVQSGVRLSMNVILVDAKQLPGQIVGRLLAEADSNIQALCRQARFLACRPCLLPLTPTLALPGGPLVRTLEGHSSHVRAVAVTSDGKRVVSASDDKTLKVWDLESGSDVLTLRGHLDNVSAVTVTPDGTCVVSGSNDNTLKVWDLKTGHELRTLKRHRGEVRAVVVTPDGKRLVSASSDNTLKVWHLDTGRELCTLEGHRDTVNAVAVTSDGQRAVSGSVDKTVKVWDLETGRELRSLEGHTDGVNAVVVTPDGKRAVSGSTDSTLKVWDLETGRELRTLEEEGLIIAIALTPDGTRIISASWSHTENPLKVWGLDTGRMLTSLEGHRGLPFDVVATPDGKHVISAYVDNSIKVWNLDPDGKRSMPVAHGSLVAAVAVTPTRNLALSGSADTTVKVWNAATGRLRFSLKGHKGIIFDIAVTPDEKQLISGCGDKTLKVWNLEVGQEQRTLKGHTASIKAVVVTPDGKRLISASDDKTLMLWDLGTGRKIFRMKGHSAEVGTVAMTQDGKLLVSGSDDKTLNVWDLERGRKLQTLKGHSDGVSEIVLTRDWRCAVSVAGRGLSEGSNDKTLKVWDLETGQNLRTLVGHTDKVKTVAVTPDGSCVVSGSDDKTLKVWDLATGRELHTFRGHAEGVRSVIVTPDGKRTVSVSNDKTLRVWDLQAGTPLAVFTADSHVIVCAVDHNGKTLVAGDALGHVHFLSYEEDSAGLQSELRATGNEGTDYQDDESVQDQVERVATDLRKTGIVIFSLIASAFAVFTPVDFLLLHRWLRSLPLWILAVGAIITAMLELALALSALYFVLRHGPKRKPSLHEGFAEDRPWEPGSLENRAALYFDQGRYRKAARLYRKELKQSERVRGADHPDTLLLANSLANCYYSQGRYGDAEPFYMRTLEAMERVLGTDHSNTLTVLINLAALYYDQNRYEEAEPLYRRAVETLERLLGGEHPDTLTALSRLAELYCNQGRFGEAEPLYVQALETSEQTLGADHPDLLAALSNLASLNYRQGRYEEAGQLFGRALDSMERALGPEHSNTLRLVNNLGNSYQGQRRFGEAELLHRRAFETSERVLGAEHPETLIPLISLASLYCNQGRFGDAEPVYRQALESLERALGAEPSSALTAAHLTSMISMADALTRNGRNGDVRVLCRLSTGHSDVNPLQLRQLALACYHGGCYAEALNLLGRVLDRGFEIAATHIHIARVLVMMDLMNEAQQHVHLAREHSGADTPYVNQRILFFETLFAALRDRQPDEILQALAVEFSRPENFMEWRLEMLLEHIRYKLTLENITLLIALSHVINNRNAMPEIEAQPAWRRAVLRG